MKKLFEEFYKRYKYPEVEELDIGFAGIDPPLKNNGSSINHEELNNLLGGDEKGHYHLTKEQIERLMDLFDKKYPPVIYNGQFIDAIPDEEISPYQVQGENVTLTE